MTGFVKNTKRSLHSTMMLLAAMLYTSPRKNSPEEEFSPVAAGLFGEWEGKAIIDPILTELKEQGYLTEENGKLIVTPYGQKVALTCTHNTPDFPRLASGNVNTAFSMLFAATSALETHLANQERLEPKKDDRMVTSIRRLVEFYAGKLGLTVVEAQVAETPKKAKQKA